MDDRELETHVAEAARRHGMPGAAVGLTHAGRDHYAFHGVTSIDNPLPVDGRTLFQIGSITKTFTATAILRLVADRRIDLDAPVRSYLPELRLRDEAVAEAVTIRHLLNHTAGWAGDLFAETGDGDDALARYVEAMAVLEQETPLGSAVSYNNASFSLAGRVVEIVTGATYERAMRDLVFEPLGLGHCLFFPKDVMTRRFAVGHRQSRDGSLSVARTWALPRANAPAGGISSNVADQITWAQVHMGDARPAYSTSILPRAVLRRMQEPTADAGGSALGDHIGLAWLMRDVEGVRQVGHDGGTIGQIASLLMVPERDWALVVLTNSAPNGSPFIRDVRSWALKACLGVEEADPQPVAVERAELEAFVGVYRSIGYHCTVSIDGSRLMFAVRHSPEVAERLQEPSEEPDEPPPFPVGLLPGDRYVIMDGPAKSRKGYFSRDAGGTVDSVHVFGRLLRSARGAD